MSNNLKSKIVVGLMSGTSIDGIDACVTRINPDLTVELIKGIVFEFPENIKKEIFSLLEPIVSMEKICRMNFILGEYFALASLEVIKQAGLSSENVDLIGSHGQTVYHIPTAPLLNGLNQNSTLQIGEPSIIAERTGITTIADFRPRDIAVGGQGAPLVCFADEIFFSKDKIARAIQNIGGMANVTVVSPDVETFAFDTGPGNVLIDSFVTKFFNKEYDKDGEIAYNGTINKEWLEYLMNDVYYKQIPPKTTGREKFSKDYAEKILQNAPENKCDIITTISALTAKSIYKAYQDFIFPKTSIKEIILGGGGAYNPFIVEQLKQLFGSEIKILKHEDYGISSKFKEALAFALLAYTTFYNIPNNIPSCTGALNKRVLGKIIPGNNFSSTY